MNEEYTVITIDNDPRKSLTLASMMSGAESTAAIEAAIEKMKEKVLSGVGEFSTLDLPLWINVLEGIADSLKNGLSESGRHTYELLRQKTKVVTTIHHERSDSEA
jgi:hypothetical protein